MGSRQLRCPKVSKGERREAGIQWIQPPKAVSAPEFRQTTSGAHGSANRADCLPRGKPFGAPAGACPLPRVGIDAPTTARAVGLPPRRGIVLSFDAKESTKESMRHGDSGKKPFIAHFAGGARYVARSIIGQLSPAIRRAPNSPFSAVKMGGPFSLRCLSPPSPPRSAWCMLKFCRLGNRRVSYVPLQRKKRGCLFSRGWL